MIGEVPRVLEADSKGEPKLANERFANSGELREVCQAMISADRPRATLRSDVDGLADGNPTWALAAMKAKQQGWRARGNHRGLEGLLQNTGNAFYDLNTEVNPCVRIFLDHGRGQEREDWQECMAKHYTWMLLSQWKSFDHHIQLRNTEMLRHGVGAHVWPTKNKWVPSTPRAGQLLFPEGSSVDFHSEGESFMLREFVPAHILYGYIQNEKAARKLGWNPDLVWKTLARSSKSGWGVNGSNSPEDAQRALKRGDYGSSASRKAGVWLNSVFIIEPDTQKISLYIVPESEDIGGYLFKKRNHFDEFPLVLFPYEVAADIHSIRGLGRRCKDHFEIINRMTNAMIDSVLISAYPQVKQSIQNIDPDKLKLMSLGAMKILPYGVEPSLVQLPPLNNSGIALSRELKGSINENNQTYLPGTPEPRDRETALSFSMRAQDSARVSKGSHSLYYRGVTRFHEKVLPMACKDNASDKPWAVLARKFRERCLADNVPKEAFNHIVEIQAMRSIGAGSAAAKIQAMTTLFQTIYPVTTEDRKIAIERDFVSAITDYSQTDRYARNVNDNELPDSDDSMAAVESDALALGGDAVVAPKQNHAKHAGSHLQKAAMIVQAVQAEEMSPEQALVAIQKIGEHVGQHLAQIEGNPTLQNEFKALQKEWQALAQIADDLQAMIKDAADEVPPEQQLSEDGQIKLARVQSDSQIKTAKAQGDEQRKWRKTFLGERIADVKLRAQLQRQKQSQNGQKQSAG